ncbi:MAG: hypothetical protein ACFBSD_14615 [Paracoccaceae bacterium]
MRASWRIAGLAAGLGAGIAFGVALGPGKAPANEVPAAPAGLGDRSAEAPGGEMRVDARSARACLGARGCRLDRARLEAAPPGARISLQIDRARGGVSGLGIARDPGNGFNDAELQGPVAGRGGERLTIRLDGPHLIGEIRLAHLFNPEHIDGDPAEAAVVDAWLGAEPVGRLRVTSLDDREIAVEGPVEDARRVSPVAGVIRLIEPFRGAPVDRVVFSAAAVEGGDSSDYSLNLFRATPTN